MEKPKLIVITPVRNEAWVLEAFLTHCSSWADHIIVADQHSTDGSREIAMMFPKVILIDNPTCEWVEFRCRARLLEEAQKICGDKIIFGLDADELLSEGFEKTKDWQHILESKPNELFGFNWFSLYGDLQHGKEIKCNYEWAGHYESSIDLVNIYLKQNKNAVHCARIPLLEHGQTRWTYFNDIHFVHLASLNRERTRNKLDFYSVVNIDKNPHKSSPIGLYRVNAALIDETAPLLARQVSLPSVADEKGQSIDCAGLVKKSDSGWHYIEEISAILQRRGYRPFYGLAIWDNPALVEIGVSPAIPFGFKLLHNYLRKTQHIANKRYIRIVDGLLKRLYKF